MRSPVASCAGAGIFLLTLAPISAAEPTFIGAETCLACHEEQGNSIAGTSHGHAGFSALSPNGCETCHGPGSAHAEDPDNLELRPSLDRLLPAERSALCASCHAGGKQFFWNGSAHATQGVACTDCHSVHSPKSAEALLQHAGEVEQCVSCHKDVRADMWKNSHHPIREGKMGCADCHNPHGGEGPKMLIAASVNDQCYQCHAEKRGPFLWEHAPVRENCVSCHAPHGSNHLKLQKTSVPYLCQQCHANTRHPGTLYDNTTLADAARASNRIFNRACLDCHASIHGSNDPSSPYLGH